MRPAAQIITLMEFGGPTFAMGDHDDHIHVGWRPLYGTNSKMAKQVNAILKPEQWIKLIDRLGEIDNPTVRRKPSLRFAKTAAACCGTLMAAVLALTLAVGLWLEPLFVSVLEDPTGFRGRVLSAMPKMIFALVPVFAGVVALFYHRRLQSQFGHRSERRVQPLSHILVWWIGKLVQNSND